MKHYQIRAFDSQDEWETILEFKPVSVDDWEEYLAVENKFLDLLDLINVKFFKLNLKLEMWQDNRGHFPEYAEYLKNIDKPYLKVCGGLALIYEELEVLSRLTLREFAWFKAIAKDFYISFGDEMTMYVGCEFGKELVELAEETGLIVYECEDEFP